MRLASVGSQPAPSDAGRRRHSAGALSEPLSALVTSPAAAASAHARFRPAQAPARLARNFIQQ